jgi:hypothetical protein
MNSLLSKCPVCESELTITRLYCGLCDTTIEGHFSPDPNPFTTLTPEQQQFVLTFVRCEGRINRMEDELKVSYPTIRNRLMDIIHALGFEPGRDEAASIRPGIDDRRRILEELDQGKINVDQASRALQGLPV